jgi:hypothetical protein
VHGDVLLAAAFGCGHRPLRQVLAVADQDHDLVFAGAAGQHGESLLEGGTDVGAAAPDRQRRGQVDQL